MITHRQAIHLCWVATLIPILGFAAGASATSPQTPHAYGTPADLPLPSTLPLQTYEQHLYPWLMYRKYAQLGWAKDKMVRDTGSFVDGNYYATHPAVRIYYSPEVTRWLKNGRKGELPDGAMIIKEMFAPPAVMYQELANAPKYKNNPDAYESLLVQLITEWTVMVRDRAGSQDGWFWAAPTAPKQKQSIQAAVKAQLDDYKKPLGSSFGSMCLRCHASAENEFTFSTLANIKGFLPDEAPLRYAVDNSWRRTEHFKDYPLSLLKTDPYVQDHFMLEKPLRPWSNPQKTVEDLDSFHVDIRQILANNPHSNTKAPKKANQAFLNTFPSISTVSKKRVKKFPSWWADHVVPQADSQKPYITASNCLGCHGGLGGSPSGVEMFVQTGPDYGEGYNISPFGEWRWSPMGLAGRDPIFHAQLESEMAYLERDAERYPKQVVGSLAANQQQLTNACLSCHGAMGQRSLAAAAHYDKSLDPNFKTDYFYLTTALKSDGREIKDYPYHEYGELAREGISCTVCHHMTAPDEAIVDSWRPPEAWINDSTDKQLAFMLFHNTTGNYNLGDPNKLYGPFKDVAEKPMQRTLGMEPEYNAYTRDSQLCGTCHTINLPNIGMTENKYPVLTEAAKNPLLGQYNHSIEQATFLEWQNSAFAQGEGQKGSDFASCQDCHMPNKLDPIEGEAGGQVAQLKTKIATIQDANYPTSENTLPAEEIDIPIRADYRRHTHVGLNAFLLEMFKQFPTILGVHEQDPMTFAKNGVDFAIKNVLYQAQHLTADLDVRINSIANGKLLATVTVTNKAGHRFPSGVGFRRAFLEFRVLEGEKTIWVSGNTNEVGVIVDGQGQPLNTEFLDKKGPDGKILYQHHHQKITRQNQVQIYEELNQNSHEQFTTSFVHRVKHIKDNRLLPKGWRAAKNFKSQGEVMYQFMEATDPFGVKADPDYQDPENGSNFLGKDSLQYEVTLPTGVDKTALSVKVSLYYQSIPPYWLHHRFSAAPNGIATQRLYYLASHLALNNTALENWKLPIQSATANISQ